MNSRWTLARILKKKLLGCFILFLISVEVVTMSLKPAHSLHHCRGPSWQRLVERPPEASRLSRESLFTCGSLTCNDVKDAFLPEIELTGDKLHEWWHLCSLIARFWTYGCRHAPVRCAQQPWKGELIGGWEKVINHSGWGVSSDGASDYQKIRINI